MALMVSPADGFISRLLQQQAHPPVSRAPSGSSKPAATQDQISISNEARQTAQATSSHQHESKLLELYNQKGNSDA